jgi:hypothetical protein
MTRTTSSTRRNPLRAGALAGLLFAGLIVVLRVIEGSGMPDATATTSTAVHFWTEHRTEQIVASVITSFVAVALVWFAGTLRTVLRRAEGDDGTLANLAYGGAILGAVGILIGGVFEYAAAHSAGHVSAQVTQTLSVLQADSWMPISAGFGIFGIAAGLVGVRTAALPVKLSWLSLVAGVLWLTPVAFVAIALSVAYVGAAGAVLYRRESRAPASAAPLPV